MSQELIVEFGPGLPAHVAAPAFAHTRGPRDARVMFVGEAWGQQEELAGGVPFIGASGQELQRMSSDAGLRLGDCLLTNVLALRPPDNKVEALCAKKADVGPGYALPALRHPGHYLRPEYLPELQRLRDEISAVRPNLVVALGATATWALLRTTAIGSIRGAIAESVLLPGLKVLPTYHPAAVIRNWSWRTIVVADLLKARREAKFPEIRRPARYIYVNPNLEGINQWISETVLNPPRYLAVDIETKAGQISCIGFARSRSEALVVPFVDLNQSNGSYWDSLGAELTAWAKVRLLLESSIPKIFQNGLFDLQYLARMGFRPRNCLHDTMLLHHSLYPELQKGLGFLGSIYSNEPAWKLMRKEESLKRDD